MRCNDPLKNFYLCNSHILSIQNQKEIAVHQNVDPSLRNNENHLGLISAPHRDKERCVFMKKMPFLWPIYILTERCVKKKKTKYLGMNLKKARMDLILFHRMRYNWCYELNC